MDSITGATTSQSSHGSLRVKTVGELRGKSIDNNVPQPTLQPFQHLPLEISNKMSRNQCTANTHLYSHNAIVFVVSTAVRTEKHQGGMVPWAPGSASGKTLLSGQSSHDLRCSIIKYSSTHGHRGILQQNPDGNDI